MSKQNLSEILVKASEELSKATKERDDYEMDYELEKARMMFSAEVNSLGNQNLREAQVTVLLEERGMYRTMAELRTKARVAYYKWATFKSLVDGDKGTLFVGRE
jgi:hypothetical protein